MYRSSRTRTAHRCRHRSELRQRSAGCTGQSSADINWTTRTFPTTSPGDAFYVVNNTGSHSGPARPRRWSRDLHAADQFAASPSTTASGAASDITSALGYSYDADPNFMYCAEDMTTTNGTINWWLPSCGLTGGSSGGPWVQPMSGANGPIISVNSWGYTNSPGMAGPKFYQTSTSCVFGAATTTAFANIPGGDGNAGVAFPCP